MRSHVTYAFELKLTPSDTLLFWPDSRPYINTVQVGDKLPEITVFEAAPDGAVNVTDIFKGKKGVLFGVPGAFTPGCSKVIMTCDVS